MMDEFWFGAASRGTKNKPQVSTKVSEGGKKQRHFSRATTPPLECIKGMGY
jgi:hypothetical protein